MLCLKPNKHAFHSMIKYANVLICITCAFMNIHELIKKTINNKGKSLKTQTADFIPILSLLHVLISSVLQIDKFIHPVVLYEYYFICIFLKIHEKNIS